MNKHQFREDIVRPSIKAIGLWSPAAEELMMGVGAVESNLGEYVRQVEGPALGMFQMEPASHDDIWLNVLKYKPALAAWLLMLVSERGRQFNSEIPVYAEEMVTNSAYAAAMARVQLYRWPAALPAADDIAGQEAYHKKYYNSVLGKTKPGEYTHKYNLMVA